MYSNESHNLAKWSQERQDKYTNCLNKYAEWLQQNLYSKANDSGMEYAQTRGLTDTLIKEFGIGYVGKTYGQGWKAFLNKYDPDFNEDDLEKCGLIYFNDTKNDWSDCFENRLMFPIKNINGDVVGFTGRTTNDSEPKYLNSKESRLFRKGEIIYNFNEVHKTKPSTIVLCEGQMDCIAYHKIGIKNSVAMSGVALTDTQVNLIKQHKINDVVLSFDNDEAGQKSILVNGKKLLSQGFQVNVRDYKNWKAKDIDEVLTNYEDVTKQEIESQQIPYLHFVVNYFTKQYETSQSDLDLQQGVVNTIKYLQDLPNVQKILPVISKYITNKFNLVEEDVKNCINVVFDNLKHNKPTKTMYPKYHKMVVPFEDIVERADMLSVIQPFIQGGLKRKGGTYFGHSPWGLDKTPSFAVSLRKKLWNDFSSTSQGMKGNVIAFAQYIDDSDKTNPRLKEKPCKTPAEAAKYVCDVCGLEVDWFKGDEIIDKYKQEHELLSGWTGMHNKFLVNPLKIADCEAIRQSFVKLLEQNKISVEIMKKYQLGVNYWYEGKPLYIQLPQFADKVSQLEQLGVNKTLQDKLVIPIRTKYGKINGFLGVDKEGKIVLPQNTLLWNNQENLVEIDNSKPYNENEVYLFQHPFQLLSKPDSDCFLIDEKLTFKQGNKIKYKTGVDTVVYGEEDKNLIKNTFSVLTNEKQNLYVQKDSVYRFLSKHQLVNNPNYLITIMASQGNIVNATGLVKQIAKDYNMNEKTLLDKYKSVFAEKHQVVHIVKEP